MLDKIFTYFRKLSNLNQVFSKIKIFKKELYNVSCYLSAVPVDIGTEQLRPAPTDSDRPRLTWNGRCRSMPKVKQWHRPLESRYGLRVVWAARFRCRGEIARNSISMRASILRLIFHSLDFLQTFTKKSNSELNGNFKIYVFKFNK